MNKKRQRKRVVTFFMDSIWLDYTVTRPLSHIAVNWELIWKDCNSLYLDEEDSFASHLNDLIEEISVSSKPTKYHKFMDLHLFKRTDIVLQNKYWVYKDSGQKVDVEMLGHFNSQESLVDEGARNLVLAVAGRFEVARKNGVTKYDNLDDNHMSMMAQLLISILYTRSSSPSTSGRLL